MKQILLGTSALCVVAVAGPAFAQSANEPVKLGLGGYWNSAYGYIPLQSGSQKGGKRHPGRAQDGTVPLHCISLMLNPKPNVCHSS